MSSIFGSFLRIGAFTFGGGYAMIPLIEREVIDRRRWIERREFLDLLTLAQSVPGPISLNTAVFVGYRCRRLPGALAALAGTILPSFAVILLVALFFAGIRNNAVVDAAFKGMRPAVVALIIGPVLSLARGLHPAYFVAIGATALAVWGLGWSPIWVLAAAALAGIAWELLRHPKSAGRTPADSAGHSADTLQPSDPTPDTPQPDTPQPSDPQPDDPARRTERT